MSLSTKAVLTSLKISVWTGRKKDKTATGQVEASFSTEKQVGNYTKKLLPQAKELDEVEAVGREARKFLEKNSLPWLSDGSRILSAMSYMETATELRNRKRNFESKVSAFLSNYETLRESSRVKLGSLFNSSDYPTVEALRGKFSFDVSFLPIPEVSDFRVEILDSEKEEFLSSMKRVETDSINYCYEKLREVVEKAAETLRKPDARFQASLLENIVSICGVLPKLNVYEDSTLEATRREVEAIVSGLSVEDLRDKKDTTERENAARKLAEITEKLKGLI